MPSDAAAPRADDQHVRPCLPAITVCTKVWLEVDGTFAIGAGGIELLKNVAQHGSLAEAARRNGWSYRHAWGYVRRSERTLGVSLVEARPGKGAQRGAALTPAAVTLIEQFQQIAKTHRTATPASEFV